MAGVAAADYNCFFVLSLRRNGTGKFRRVNEPGAFECGEPFKVRGKVRLSTVAGCLDYVLTNIRSGVLVGRMELPLDGKRESLSCHY